MPTITLKPHGRAMSCNVAAKLWFFSTMPTSMFSFVVSSVLFPKITAIADLCLCGGGFSRVTSSLSMKETDAPVSTKTFTLRFAMFAWSGCHPREAAREKDESSSRRRLQSDGSCPVEALVTPRIVEALTGMAPRLRTVDTQLAAWRTGNFQCVPRSPPPLLLAAAASRPDALARGWCRCKDGYGGARPMAVAPRNCPRAPSVL